MHFLQAHAVIVWLVVGFVAVIAVNYCLKRGLIKLIAVAERRQRFWDEALFRSLQSPARLAMWVVSLFLYLTYLFYVLGIQFSFADSLLLLKQLFFTLVMLWFLLSFVQRVETRLLSDSSLVRHKVAQDKMNIRLLARVIRVVLIVLVVLNALQAVGQPIGSFLAIGGVGALAVSFAAKDTLANFFGGMMLYIDRPFSVGDWIRSPDRNIEGTVEHIGWRLSRIRTFDKRPLYIPNGTFANISVENPSRMTNRRIKATVGLRYDDALVLRDVVTAIRAMLAEHDDIDQSKTTFARLVNFGDSTLDILIYTFTKTTDWVTFQAVQEDVFLKVIDIIAQHGAECAFPTQTLHMPGGLPASQ